MVLMYRRLLPGGGLGDEPLGGMGTLTSAYSVPPNDID